MSFSSLKESLSFIQLFIITFFILWVVFPYLKVELLSFMYLPAVNEKVTDFCRKKQLNNNLKYTKMLSKNNLESRVLCVYEDNSENLIISLRKLENSKWDIYFNTKQETPGNFYWPYYP
jgi:hypothetical protein